MTGQTSWRGDKNPKPVVPVDGSGNIVGGAALIPTSTATLSSTDSSASNVTVLAANSARKGAIFHNTDANTCYLKYGATATTSSFTVPIGTGQTWVMDTPVYTGIVDAIWGADGSGALKVTEL